VTPDQLILWQVGAMQQIRGTEGRRLYSDVERMLEFAAVQVSVGGKNQCVIIL